MGKFDRMSAVRYALNWAYRSNPAFPNYHASAGGGGDCTNFVSQVMIAGGWTMIDGGKHDPTSWWAYNNSTSVTWSSAQWFDRFLRQSSRVTACTIDALDHGDIVMLQAPDFHYPDHAMVVTKRLCATDGDEIYLTYHSTDTLCRSLQDIQAAYSKDTLYFYWKVANVFKDPVNLNDNIKLINRVS